MSGHPLHARDNYPFIEATGRKGPKRSQFDFASPWT
jgi:hypothetical protein